MKNRKFKVRKSCCFCFPYTKKDASSTEWLQPTGDEANKRVSRSYAGSSSRSTPGYIYVITMNNCEGHRAPPFVKVGYTNDCNRRITELQAGNPHQLVCRYTWWVYSRHEAERDAHNALDLQGLRVNCYGGTEWFRVPGGLNNETLGQFAHFVRTTIGRFIQEEEKSEESSEESSEEDRDLAESSINLAPNQAAAKIATNYGHNNTNWRQDLKGNMLHVKYNCK